MNENGTPQAFNLERTRQDILFTILAMELPLSDYIVVGGANLVTRGMQDTTPDVDLLVSGSAFEALSRHPHAQSEETMYGVPESYPSLHFAVGVFGDKP